MSAKKRENNPQDLSFSQLLSELEKVVEKLESGQIELEEALTVYEEGKKIANLCQEKLRQAEQRLTVINQQGQTTDIPEDLKSDCGVYDE